MAKKLIEADKKSRLEQQLQRKKALRLTNNAGSCPRFWNNRMINPDGKTSQTAHSHLIAKYLSFNRIPPPTRLFENRAIIERL